MVATMNQVTTATITAKIDRIMGRLVSFRPKSSAQFGRSRWSTQPQSGKDLSEGPGLAWVTSLTRRRLAYALRFFFGKYFLNLSLGLVIVPFTNVHPSNSSLLI